MSRPKAWNGSAWVDPGFWTGSEYKFYVPPVYDVLEGYTFNSAGDAAGWSLSASEDEPPGWVAGSIYADSVANESGAGQRQLWSPDQFGKIPDQSRKVRFAYQWQISNFVQGSSPTTKLHVTCGGAALGSPTWTESYTAGNIPARWFYTPAEFGLAEVLGIWGGTTSYLGVEPDNWVSQHPGYRLSVLHMECQYSDGTPVMSLGNPGWEPKVRQANGTWK